MKNEVYGRITQERSVIKFGTITKIRQSFGLGKLSHKHKSYEDTNPEIIEEIIKNREKFLKGDFLLSEKDTKLAQKIIEKIREKGDEVREYSFRLYLKGGTDKNKEEAIEIFHWLMRKVSEVFKAKIKKPKANIEMLTYYPKLEPEIERELIFTTSGYKSETEPTQLQKLIMKETGKSLSQPFLAVKKK